MASDGQAQHNVADQLERAHGPQRAESSNGSTLPPETKEGSIDDDPKEQNLLDPSKWLVDWDGTNDPDNPRTWSTTRKVLVSTVLDTLPLICNVGTSILGQGAQQIGKEYHVGTEVTILVTTCFMLGFTFGPLIFGPLSERFGRRIPILSGVVLFATFCLPSALAQNVYTIFICRFFSGIGASASMSVTAGALADIWSSPVTRGISLDVFVATGFVGPVIGPIAGAFIVQSSLRWRWTMWITAIFAYSFSILAFFTVPETFSPVLLVAKAKEKRFQTKNFAWHAKSEEGRATASDFMRTYLLRPYYLLTREPILILMTLYMSFIYGLLFLFFEAFPISFQSDRHWSQGIASLPFIGLFLGVIVGMAIVLYVTLTTFARQVSTGKVVPESRLPVMIVGGVLLPIGLFWFAWTSHPGTSWVAQAFATIPTAAGMFIIFMQGFKYIVDVYLAWANSAVSANTCMRSFFGAGFPLFAPAMMHNLGIDWGVSVLAFISVAMAPVPVAFYVWGKDIRGWSSVVQNKG